MLRVNRAGAIHRVLAIAMASLPLAVACQPSAPASTSTPAVTSPAATPAATASATTQPTPQATATPAPTAGADVGRQWATLPPANTLRNATITDLTATGTGLLASGALSVPTERRIQGAIWQSQDGRSWRQLTARRGFDDAVVGPIARGPGGRYLALGRNCGFESECGGLRVWSSTDGTRWSALETNLPDTGDIELLSTDNRWVAIGNETELTEGPLMVWTSANGRTWTEKTVERTPAIVSGAVEFANRFIAFGTSFGAPNRSEPAVWTSLDGDAWTRLPRQAAPSGAGGDALVVKDDTLFAFVRTARALEIWTSQDGMAWEHQSGATAPFEVDGLRAVRFLQVAEVGANLVAIGSVPDSPENIPPVGVWVSADGLEWEEADDMGAFDRAVVHDLVAFRTEALAVGTVACPGAVCPGPPQFWVSPPG